MKFTKKFIAGLFYHKPSGEMAWVDLKLVSYQSDDRNDARDFFVQRFKDPEFRKYEGRLYIRRDKWWYWVEWWEARCDGTAVMAWKASGDDFENLQPIDFSSATTKKRFVFRLIGTRIIEIAVDAYDYESALSRAKAVTKGKYILQLDRVE